MLAVMIYSHFSVALLCLNVLFDLVVFGLPTFLLYAIGLLPSTLYLKMTTMIINYTTPIVMFMPMMFSGTTLYVNDVDLLVECNSTNSLLLANHGSRIDWMVGMFVGFTKHLAGKTCERIRVGFVCEAISEGISLLFFAHHDMYENLHSSSSCSFLTVGFMPIIGWYRKIVAQDIFVWRSFKQDAPTIKKNIEDFHTAGESRMLFLSPEGVVVDFGEKDIDYINECRQFCIDQSYTPFDYVLTPRYKGSMCLLQQVKQNSGPVVSVCLAYVRDGKLLNCSLLSPERSVPDIYTLNAGVGGSPVDIYIHLKRIHIAQDINDPKSFMMENYKEKDALMRKWDLQLKGKGLTEEWMSQFKVVQNNYLECMLYQVGHVFLMLGAAIMFDRVHTLLKVSCSLFCIVASAHTIGWLLNSTSMESVPFETCIKSVALSLQNMMKGKSKRKEA